MHVGFSMTSASPISRFLLARTCAEIQSFGINENDMLHRSLRTSRYIDRDIPVYVSQIKRLRERRSVKSGLFRISALRSTLLSRINGLICFLYNASHATVKNAPSGSQNKFFVYLRCSPKSAFLINGIEFFSWVRNVNKVLHAYFSCNINNTLIMAIMHRLFEYSFNSATLRDTI